VAPRSETGGIPMRRMAVGWMIVLLPILAGCGPGRGKVTGQVFFEGKPVPGGRVTFRPADPRHNSVSAELDGQGGYEALLPVGDVQACVDNRELEPQPSFGAPIPAGVPAEVRGKLGGGGPSPPNEDGTSGKPSARYVPIPERYYQVETANLQLQV